MGIVQGIKKALFGRNDYQVVSKYKLVSDRGEGFFSYDGKLYKSDIVRACIRPKAQAVGKAVGKHIRKDAEGNISINPDPYLRFLLEEPNELMTGQMLQEKLTVQLMLNHNAFALIVRDDNGLPEGVYPINSSNVEALKDDQGRLYLRFLMGGKYYIFKYSDILHLRRDFNNSNVFGDSPVPSLSGLMEVMTTTDQGIVKAIKNSAVVKWLLKFNQTLRDDDIKRNTKNFIESYLSTDSELVGAAATDAKFDAQQVEPKNYVPENDLTKSTIDRIYSFFNTNEAIVQSSYSEDQWISYYEAEVEPVVTQLSGEYTRKLFTRRERGHGNKVIFESSNLNFASMHTKLNLVQFVDRGILNPDEVREILNFAPIPGGEGQKYIRRLDTRPTEEDKGVNK